MPSKNFSEISQAIKNVPASTICSLLISLATLILTSPILYDFWFKERLVISVCNESNTIVAGNRRATFQNGSMTVLNEGRSLSEEVWIRFRVPERAAVSYESWGLEVEVKKAQQSKRETVFELATYDVLIPFIPAGRRVEIYVSEEPRDYSRAPRLLAIQFVRDVGSTYEPSFSNGPCLTELKI